MNRIGNIGLLLVGIAVLVWVCVHSSKPPKADYQLVQLGDMARNQFLIEKNSGRIWNKVCNGQVLQGTDCDGDLMWQEMYILGLTPADSVAALIHNAVIEKNKLTHKDQ